MARNRGPKGPRWRIAKKIYLGIESTFGRFDPPNYDWIRGPREVERLWRSLARARASARPRARARAREVAPRLCARGYWPPGPCAGPVGPRAYASHQAAARPEEL